MYHCARYLVNSTKNLYNYLVFAKYRTCIATLKEVLLVTLIFLGLRTFLECCCCCFVRLFSFRTVWVSESSPRAKSRYSEACGLDDRVAGTITDMHAYYSHPVFSFWRESGCASWVRKWHRLVPKGEAVELIYMCSTCKEVAKAVTKKKKQDRHGRLDVKVVENFGPIPDVCRNIQNMREHVI